MTSQTSNEDHRDAAAGHLSIVNGAGGPSLQPNENIGPQLKSTLHNSVDPAALHDENEIRRLKLTIVRTEHALRSLEQELLEQQITDGQLYKTIRKHEILSRNLDAMEGKRCSLEWRRLARSWAFGLSPDKMESIPGICRNIGNTTTVIAAFSATVSVSILFSGVRGNLLFFYAAWWCAVISLTSSLVLGVLRDTNRPPRSIDWLKLHLSAVVALLCLFAAITSVVTICYGVVYLNVSAELRPNLEDPRIDNGPGSPDGVKTPIVVLSTLIMMIIFVGVFVPFIRPFRVAHQNHWTQRAERQEIWREKRRSLV